jgi:hypothetical protein
MGIDNTQDGAEPSLASVGSQPVLWALEWQEDAGRIDPEWVYGNREEATDVNETGCYGRAAVVPLYRSPSLTDAEREAVDRARIAFRDMDHNDMTMQQIEDYEAICDLLERTK